MKRVLAAMSVVLLAVLGLGSPAQATDYDFSVSVSATATGSVPSVITWTVVVSSIGAEMGQFAAQEGTVEFDVPASISLALSDDCDVSGSHITCSWLVGDSDDQEFVVNGLVTLTALGQITVVPTITASSPRTDSNAGNDSDTVSCTAFTSLVVLC